ncbi:hypothetical protein [Bradyrhizobium liaoningense]|uniref:hypothetical protein n=1 Tax=Bradyrhizobium liaoningense TaxID=43992 RepID=UPI001BACA306|nr:hypothetical protein [Bradyrhizobium liaoningense]MBR1033408.1 hypothetical protein [Bradyrhizobium liaoningense]
MDCDRLKALCEQMHRCQPCTSDSASGRPKARLQQAPRDPQASGPTPEDIRYNRGFLGLPYKKADLFRTGMSAEEQIRHAVEQYRAEPSPKRALLIEVAINRIGISGQSDKELDRLVEEAKLLLSKKLDGKDEFKGDNVTGTIYQHSDFHGASMFLNLSSVGALLTGFVSLGAFNFNDKVSSAEHSASADEVGGRLFLFQDDRFFGRYVKLDADGGETPRLSSLGSFMNDRTSSVLIYRKSANEFIVPLGSLVSDNAITNLISSQDRLSTRGDPIFTWDLFPDGKDAHPNETGKMYIYIRIPVTIDVPDWPFDYDAEIRFWIYLYVTQDGRLHGQLDYYGAWVEGGLLTNAILSYLMGPDGIQTSLAQVNGLLDSTTALANLKEGPFSNSYLLPGRNEDRGNTNDDVTIVLVKGMPSDPGPIFL